MAIQTGVWGIDLGQCGLKAIRLVEVEGVVQATAFDYIEHPKILSQPDADPDQLTREALEKFLSRNVLRGDVVCISVPGQSGLARFVKLPPVEEKKIGDIVRFEAKQQIPFNLEEVVWAYQKLSGGTVTDGFALDTEIALFAMKRDLVARALQHFRDVNVEVQVVQMAPLALCNFAAYDLLGKSPAGGDEPAGKKSCVVVLDIGADSSNLIITDGARIIWQRPIPLGGNHFTRALTKELKLTFAKAEHLKRNATKSPELKKILAALKPVLNDFVGEVQRSLGYFTNTHRDANIEYMLGLGNAFRLPGLQRFLQEKLQLEVRKLGKFERLAGDEVVNAPVFIENLLTFPVAYGLALQGLQQARLVTNLLPPEIQMERLIRGKKPWAVAAAAALLLGLGAATLGYALEQRAFVAKSIEDAKKKGDAAMSEVSRGEKEFNDKVQGVKKEEDEIEAIVTGRREQLNWLELSKFLSDAVPRAEDVRREGALPLGTDKQLMARWISEGKTALEMRDAAREGKTGIKLPPGAKETTPVRDELPPGIDQLIQFNIEAIDCRYTDDLAAFWKKLPESILKKTDDSVRPRTDLETPPKEGEKGWVIELRGYTFHNGQRRFIVETLVEKIARMGETGPAKKLADELAKPGTADAPKSPAPPPTPGAAAPGDKPARLVSHVVLLDAVSKKTGDTGTFEKINASMLDSLTAGTNSGPSDPSTSGSTPPGTGMPGSSPPPGAGTGYGGLGSGGGSPRDSWQPIGSTTTSAGFPGGSYPGTGKPPGFGSPMGPPMPGSPSGTGPETTTGPTGTGAHTRTEFVVLFIWREPTPSDSTLPKPVEGAPGGTGGPPGMGGPGKGGMSMPGPSR